MSGLLTSNRSYLADELTQKSITVSTTAVELFTGVSRNPRRQIMRIFNDGNQPCYIGPSGVTASGSSKGEELLKGQSLEVTIGDVGIFAVTSSSSTTLIVTELA